LYIASVINYSGFGAPTGIKENLGNASGTALTQYTNFGNPETQGFYFTNPTAGAGETFTLQGYTTYSPTVCIEAWSVVSLFDSGTDSGGIGGGGGDGPNCQTGSITPSSGGNRVLITWAGWQPVDTGTVDSSFNIDATVAANPGTSYGASIASLVQSAGSAVDPTWTIGSLSLPVCAIGAFK